MSQDKQDDDGAAGVVKLTRDQIEICRVLGLSLEQYARAMIKERDETIYRMRVEEKKTLDQIANQFGVCRERIRQVIAKRERANAEEERRKAAAPDTIGSMRLSLRLRNCLHNENWQVSDRVIDLLEGLPVTGMMRIPNLGKKTVKEFADKAEKIVGADVVQRWLDGRL
jgi:hypothetical protein